MDPLEPQLGPETRVTDSSNPSTGHSATSPAPTFSASEPRRRRVRSGPIAAILATAVVIGVTALPAAPRRAAPVIPAPKTLTTSPVERVSAATAMVQLGSPFGHLEPMPGAFLEGLEGGTERFTFQLREKGADPDAPAVFTGHIEFRRPIDGDTEGDSDGASELRFFEPREAVLPGEPTLRPVESMADILPGSGAFRAARGELTGLGEYAGIQLTVRAAPGSGVWCPGDRRFAHLLWFREASTFGHAVPDMGMGEIAFRRARLR